MTSQQRKSLLAWVASIVLVPLLAWAFSTYDADVIHRREYELGRQRDSTALQRLDRRSLVTLCKLSPQDSECQR